MKNQELKSSLIKSGIVLAVFIFFIYAFAVSDSGGITGTIGSLFSGIVFLIGLTFALVLSIAVMIGIYFGILAMYDQEVCKKSYDQFKPVLFQSLGSLSKSFGSKCCTSTAKQEETYEKDIVTLRDNQNVFSKQLTQIQSSVTVLQETVNSLSSAVDAAHEESKTLATKTTTIEDGLANKASMDSVDESLKKLAGDISSLQQGIAPLSSKISELETAVSAAAKEEESVDVQEVVNTAVNSLQEELTALKASVESLSTVAQESEEVQDSEHRILTYFASQEDKDQFITLVNEAVAAEMTYAEIGELLNASLSSKNAGIIADHPSLTKDFIRSIRQKD
ncbi:MAG: hypothetical protein KJ804_01665 [Proteobacteria bacterium]|nr:hypothetical protein [Pseudomonadota bacterium]MBU1057013.1 hypothetical protein [Pseudomonadota bacterium]